MKGTNLQHFRHKLPCCVSSRVKIVTTLKKKQYKLTYLELRPKIDIMSLLHERAKIFLKDKS
jgi:hypothetical protein